MASLKRKAVFDLVVGAGTIGLFWGLLPKFGLEAAQTSFYVLFLTLLTPLFPPFFPRFRPAMDERDQMIELKSLHFTFGVMWLLMGGAVWSLYYRYETVGAVPAAYLPVIGWLMWAGFLICQSAALLILYRRY